VKPASTDASGELMGATRRFAPPPKFVLASRVCFAVIRSAQERRVVAISEV
jgi:hypothetical protein